jgi:hypothetical protein
MPSPICLRIPHSHNQTLHFCSEEVIQAFSKETLVNGVITVHNPLGTGCIFRVAAAPSLFRRQPILLTSHRVAVLSTQSLALPLTCIPGWCRGHFLHSSVLDSCSPLVPLRTLCCGPQCCHCCQCCNSLQLPPISCPTHQTSTSAPRSV